MTANALQMTANALQLLGMITIIPISGVLTYAIIGFTITAIRRFQ